MFESLKNSKNHNELFRLMSFATDSDDNPLLKTISEADSDFTYSADMVMFKFFYTIFPLVNFAVYYDDYKTVSGQSDGELRSSFLRTFKTISSSLISERGIILQY